MGVVIWMSLFYVWVLCLVVAAMNVFVFPFKALLKEHANDNPKLSYTGKPIVRWPKRVRSLNETPVFKSDEYTSGVVNYNNIFFFLQF